MDRFCWIPSLLQNVVEKFEANHGSLSEIICFGAPNQGCQARLRLVSVSVYLGVKFHLTPGQCSSYLGKGELNSDV